MLGPSRPAQDSLPRLPICGDRRVGRKQDCVIGIEGDGPLEIISRGRGRPLLIESPDRRRIGCTACHSSQTGRTTWPRRRTESRQVEAQFGSSFSHRVGSLFQLAAILGHIEMACEEPIRPSLPASQAAFSESILPDEGQGNVSRAIRQLSRAPLASSRHVFRLGSELLSDLAALSNLPSDVIPSFLSAVKSRDGAEITGRAEMRMPLRMRVFSG